MNFHIFIHTFHRKHKFCCCCGFSHTGMQRDSHAAESCILIFIVRADGVEMRAQQILWSLLIKTVASTSTLADFTFSSTVLFKVVTNLNHKCWVAKKEEKQRSLQK